MQNVGRRKTQGRRILRGARFPRSIPPKSFTGKSLDLDRTCRSGLSISEDPPRQQPDTLNRVDLAGNFRANPRSAEPQLPPSPEADDEQFAFNSSSTDWQSQLFNGSIPLTISGNFLHPPSEAKLFDILIGSTRRRRYPLPSGRPVIRFLAVRIPAGQFFRKRLLRA